MALHSEFQQKLNQQAREIRENVLPGQQGPKEHPEDILIVMNILVGDETEVQEAIPYATAHDQAKDPRTPQQFDFNRLDNHVYEHSWNTKDYFEVRWDGRPHRIKPGEQRFFPRYLADHFAKGLIDFILMRREEKEKLTGLVKNRLERAKLYKQIVVDVASYYNGDAFDSESEGFRVERQVQEINNAPSFDVGEVPNPALGYGTTDKPPEKIEDDEPISAPAPANTSGEAPKTQQDIGKNKSRQELMKEARQLGIEVTPNMTKEQVTAAILNF